MSVTCLTAGEKLYSLPCFAGFVYCLVSNPIEPGLLAVGAGEDLSSAGAKCGGTTSPCTSSSTGATSGGMASRVRPWARRPRVRR